LELSYRREGCGESGRVIWMLIGGSRRKFLERREEVGWVCSMQYGLFEREGRKGVQ